MAKKNSSKTNKMPKNYTLIDEIRADKSLYKANVRVRDKKARDFVDKNIKDASPNDALNGQLCMFNYFEPKTEEDLKYYDAMPCAMIFGHCKTKAGEPRILGWNLHYYPPKIRFMVLNRIFEIFKPYYANAWGKPLSKELSYMEYNLIMDQLQKAKLDFGVRMYIPNLIRHIKPIPPEHYKTVVFTEGHFKKQTRDAIMNYWQQWISKYKN